MKKRIIFSMVTAGAVFGLIGCGGGSSDPVDPAAPAPVTVTGQFIDTYVEGLNYTCSSGTTGVTNNDGEYTCNVGDSVEFSLGGYILGSTTASSGIVSPETLYPNDSAAALDVAQLLQTLDDDNDPSNGINIPSNFTDLDSVTTRPGDTNFDTGMEAELGEPLVDEDHAQEHMDETQLRLLFAGKTFYTTIWDDIGTMESWAFNADLTSSTWTELVGGSATGTGSLVIDGMTMTFTCTSDSEQECETNPTIIEVKEILTDYIIVEVRGGELGTEIETLRLYFDEAKARAYLLEGPPAVGLATLLAGKTLYTTIYEQMGTMESWAFNEDLTEATWIELVGGSDRGTGTLSVEGMTMIFTESDGTSTIVVTDILQDYMLIKVDNGSTQRLYYDEAKARAYFL